MTDDMKKEALQRLGDLVHFFSEQTMDPDTTPAAFLCAMVMGNAMESAFVKLDRMLNPFGNVGPKGLELGAIVMTLSATQIRDILNQMIRCNAHSVILADDGIAFQAIGVVDHNGTARQIYSSESVQ